eukprot:322615-Chlamydomonas_euryale.AAC.1
MSLTKRSSATNVWPGWRLICKNIGIGPPNSHLCSVNKNPFLCQPRTAKPTDNLARQAAVGAAWRLAAARF